PALDVREVRLAESPQPFQRLVDRLRRLDDLAVEDLAGGRDGGELQLLLGAKVRVEPALAHADVRREVADRDPLETVDGGEVGCGAEDGLAAARAVRAR